MENRNDQYQDKIDAYILGKMNPQELQAFESLMDNDGSLKQAVHRQRLLIKAIQTSGEQELRDYLRKNTSTRKTLVLNYRTWIYASAAVVFFAVISGVFIIISNKQNSAKEQLVSNTNNDSIAPSQIAKQDNTKTGPGEQRKASASNPGNERDVLPGNIYDHDKDGVEDIADMSTANMQEKVPQDIQVLGRLSLKPIVIDDILMESDKNSPVKAVPSSISKSRSENAFEKMDSSLAIAQIPGEYKLDAPESIKFKFTQSAGKYKEVIVNDDITENKGKKNETADQKSSAPSEIILVNVPYDNQAQIYFYKDKYYLKTGEDLFEIKLTDKKYQKLNQVTDHKIIQAIKSKQ